MAFMLFLKINMIMQLIFMKNLDIPVILFDTPYNRKPIPEGVIRVQDWQEANDWIKKLFPIEATVKIKKTVCHSKY